MTQTHPAIDTAALSSTLQARLTAITAEFKAVKFATSLAAEDMVLTDAILRAKLPIAIFTLNTGRLHQETVDMIGKIAEQYGYTVEEFKPQPQTIELYVKQHGLNAFYESVDLRKECCHIRKVEPLNRALSTADAWLTGQRRAQSITRANLQEREADADRGIAKFNPLFDWSTDEVWAYLKAYEVPTNPLHARGYPSIGCEPCTRAIKPGEDERAGRWWWEQADSKECGLHISSLPGSAQ
ncbi:phosphoadenylyl-sulfate reductase [Ampullimonas aquatilis]|uniref:phosphoadenylyl-sulfate reductase n=1 Tax=Ampullimonas aquatilis TaxID=1341549 RepID=UPI003C71AE3E